MTTISNTHIALNALNVPTEATVSASTTDGMQLPKLSTNVLALPHDADHALNMLDKLSMDCVVWHDTMYVSCTEKLYELLSRCLGYYELMTLAGDAGKPARSGLKNFIAYKKRRFKDGTHALNKIAYLVFGDDRRRVSAYARVLRIAYDGGIKSIEFVDWVSNAGGIEEVRRNGTDSKAPTNDNRQLVIDHLSKLNIGTISSSGITQALDASNIGSQVVLIATQGANAGLTINAVITTAAVINAALSAYYSANKAEMNTAANDQSTAASASELDAAIIAAATQAA